MIYYFIMRNFIIIIAAIAVSVTNALQLTLDTGFGLSSGWYKKVGLSLHRETNDEF